VKDKIDQGEIKIEHKPTTEMWVDILTKPKQGRPFRIDRSMLMDCPVDWHDETLCSMHPESKTMGAPWECVGMTAHQPQQPVNVGVTAHRPQQPVNMGRHRGSKMKLAGPIRLTRSEARARMRAHRRAQWKTTRGAMSRAIPASE
jgi:hypothetical protein